MDQDDLVEMYGPEYPRAVLHDGMRMPLQRESRFARHYFSEEAHCASEVSRFSDGSATITLEQLRSEWANWPDDDRRDFCSSCSWLGKQVDFPDILRYLMSNGESDHRNSIALSVAAHLPQEEAYRILMDALSKAEGLTGNLTQGIAATEHPDAPRALTALLERLWNAPTLWDVDAFVNWSAFDALCCIQHLLDLGIAPSTFEDQVRRLAEHPCERNRQSCASYLRQHYPWLPSSPT